MTTSVTFQTERAFKTFCVLCTRSEIGFAAYFKRRVVIADAPDDEINILLRLTNEADFLTSDLNRLY